MTCDTVRVGVTCRPPVSISSLWPRGATLKSRIAVQWVGGPRVRMNARRARPTKWTGFSTRAWTRGGCGARDGCKCECGRTDGRAGVRAGFDDSARWVTARGRRVPAAAAAVAGGGSGRGGLRTCALLYRSCSGGGTRWRGGSGGGTRGRIGMLRQ